MKQSRLYCFYPVVFIKRIAIGAKVSSFLVCCLSCKASSSGLALWSFFLSSVGKAMDLSTPVPLCIGLKLGSDRKNPSGRATINNQQLRRDLSSREAQLPYPVGITWTYRRTVRFCRIDSVLLSLTYFQQVNYPFPHHGVSTRCPGAHCARRSTIQEKSYQKCKSRC